MMYKYKLYNKTDKYIHITESNGYELFKMSEKTDKVLNCLRNVKG